MMEAIASLFVKQLLRIGFELEKMKEMFSVVIACLAPQGIREAM